jgi:hypothetical protein
MKQGTFNRGVLLVGCLLAFPQVAAAGVDTSIACESGRERASDSRAAVRSWCSVAVPNGDFTGAPRPQGSETGSHVHPWEPAFSWWRSTLPTEHSIGDHLLPWRFHGEGEPSYSTGEKATPGVVLSKPGDSIFQWIPLPADDGKWDGAKWYKVQVTYAAYQSEGDVGVGMKLIAADDNGEKVSQTFDNRYAFKADGLSTFVAELEVPPSTRLTQLGIAIGKTDDATPLIIRKVTVTDEEGLFIDF